MKIRELIEALEEKVKHADIRVPDPFMFQDKDESMKELEVARQILMDLERMVSPNEYKKRVWNPMPYSDYEI